MRKRAWFAWILATILTSCSVTGMVHAAPADNAAMDAAVADAVAVAEEVNIGDELPADNEAGNAEEAVFSDIEPIIIDETGLGEMAASDLAQTQENELPIVEVTRDLDHLTVANTTPITGQFFSDMWGSGTSDIDVRNLIHGYNLVQWYGENGLFDVDPTVVSGIAVTENEEGDRSFMLVLYDDLVYSDGTPINAYDYAFSILLHIAPQINELGGVSDRRDYILGYEEYLENTAPLKYTELVRAGQNTPEGEGQLYERVLQVRLPEDAQGNKGALVDFADAVGDAQSLQLLRNTDGELTILDAQNSGNQQTLGSDTDAAGQAQGTQANAADDAPSGQNAGTPGAAATQEPYQRIITANAEGFITDWHYEDGVRIYADGTPTYLPGVHVTADDTIMITIDHEYLPFFYEMGLLSCTPYPISIIAPGVEVRDDGEGVYLANDRDWLTAMYETAQAQGYFEEMPVADFPAVTAENESVGAAATLAAVFGEDAAGTASGEDVARTRARLIAAVQNADLDAPVFTTQLLRETVFNPETGYFYHPALSSGPYILTSFDGVTAEFAINPLFKGDSQGDTPAIPYLTYTLAENDTMVEKLATGEFDLLNKVTKADTINAAMQLMGAGTFWRDLPMEDAQADESGQDASDTTDNADYFGNVAAEGDSNLTDEGQDAVVNEEQDFAAAAEGSKDEDCELWKSLETFRMSNYPRTGLSFISFRCEQPTVADAAVRQALAWCMDKDQIVRDYTGGYGTRVDGYYGVGQWMVGLANGTTEPPLEAPENEGDREAMQAYIKEQQAWEDISMDGLEEYQLDLDQAKQILEENGWLLEKDGVLLNEEGIREKDGVKLDLTLIYPQGNSIAQSLKENWLVNLAKVGIRATLVPVPMGDLLSIYYRQADGQIEVPAQLIEKYAALYEENRWTEDESAADGQGTAGEVSAVTGTKDGAEADFNAGNDHTTGETTDVGTADALAINTNAVQGTTDIAAEIEMATADTELRTIDMVYLATNFDLIFDPSQHFLVDDENHNWAYTQNNDEELYKLALDMRHTEPGDLLAYMQKWVAFEEYFNKTLPMIPVYSNVYFDFYADTLRGYNIGENTMWTKAVVGASLSDEEEDTSEEDPGAQPDDEAMEGAVEFED